MESFNLDLDGAAELRADKAQNSRAHVKVKELIIKRIDLECWANLVVEVRMPLFI